MHQLSLNGAWQLRRADSQDIHQAIVPGSVYADLLRDGSMPDPFWRDNELSAFDLMRHDWVYSRTFSADEALLCHDHILLRCEGLDTIAEVVLNGVPVARADNMHITWEWPVKTLLRPGENTLAITFRSPIEFCLKEAEAHPAWCSEEAIPGFPRLRKAACMFGWDWGPRLPDAGIWRSISLVSWHEVRLTDVLVEQFHEDGHVRLRVTPELTGDTASASVCVTVTAPDGTVLTADASHGPAEIIIDKPELWWPNGYGAHPLYTVSVSMTAAGDSDVWTRRIGLRTLTVSREKDEYGESFCHEINGVKVFAMGSDYIPEDNILSRMNATRTRRLLEDAAAVNANSIRVWGGGFYPDDWFYDACDELGLMVWQDLMYACAWYDLDDDFEKSIRLETEQNVRRLRHHASLALLCGNNEIESFQWDAICATNRTNWNAFGPRRPSHHADYIKIFEYVLPQVVKANAPQTFWWPSSPSSGGNFDEPNSPNRGDTHYWDVWHGEKPFTDYRKYYFRYASEFGFQSFPCLATVKSFTEPDDRNIFSRVMELHQRNNAANGKIMNYLSQTYRYPSSFDNMLYCSQLLQADAIRYGVEHWRRNRGRCMGAVIWQLNDCWPVASWSSIDYYGRWKALHYAAKRFFAPVMISACEEGELSQKPHVNTFAAHPVEKSVQLNVANETMADVTGTVVWSLRHADGSIVTEQREEITVPALTSVWLDKQLFPDADITGDYVSFRFEQDGCTVSCGTAIFCAPKHFNFRDPGLTVEAEGDTITVTAGAFARHVCIESSDPDLLLSDNYFDMDPGVRQVTVLRGSAKDLRVRSVYDLDK